MKDLVRPNIANLKPYIPGRPIEDVQRQLGLKRVVKLASNENCLGPSPKAAAAIKESIKNINRYPDGSCFNLKSKLAAILGVGTDKLIIGNGSDEIIILAIRTFTSSGDEVVIARPTFLIYDIASEIQDLKVTHVPLSSAFKYDLKAMKQAITPKTRIVFIANPDNPTGTYVSKGELDEFFSGLPQDTIVFLDEAYFEYAAYEFKDYPNGFNYLSRPNVIVSRSFSKIYGLAGLRVGYGISSPEIINYMERVRDPFNVNLLAQAAAVAALDDAAFLKKTLKFVSGEKRYLYAQLKKIGLDYVPSATNFILINVRQDCGELFNSLLKKGVIVRDMKAWGLDTYIRVTVGTREENVMFIKGLKEILR